MKARQSLLFLVLVAIASVASAHDLWLLPDPAARAGATMRIAAHTGDAFPTGDSAVAPDRIARFELRGARGIVPVSNIAASGAVTRGEATIDRSGAYVALLEVKPRLIELEAKKFNEYLEHEGLTRILEQRAAAKKENTAGRELYAKYAKAIIAAGADASVTRPVGLRLEIVPERDPALVRPGEKLPLRVLFDGKPLQNATIASRSDAGSGDDFGAVTRTSSSGTALIPIRAPGGWLVRLVHMVPVAAAATDHDWESFFSTLTFRIARDKGFPLTVESIMRGGDLVGHGITQVRWSGDGARLYFSWRKPGERESHTYVVPRAGGTPRRLSDEEARHAPPATGGDYTKDRRRAVFFDGGELVLLDTVSSSRKVLLRTSDAAAAPRFTADERFVTFVRQSNLYRLALDGSELVQMTDIRPGPAPPQPKLTESQKLLDEQQKELFEAVRERAVERKEAEAKRKEREKRKPYYTPARSTVSPLELSPDSTVVLISESERAEAARAAIVPNFLGAAGYTEDISARVKVGDAQGKTRMGIVSVESGAVVWIDAGQKDREVLVTRPIWSEDGKNLAVTAVARDSKDRWLLAVDAATGKTRVLDAAHDDAWVGFAGSAGWMRDDASLYFTSEKSGFTQIYTVGLDGAPARPLTSGTFEVSDAGLSRDRATLYFTSNEVHPGERHFYAMAAPGGERRRLTSMPGNNQVVLSPDERRMAIVRSYTNRPPELYLADVADVADAGASAEPLQITVTPTDEWRSFSWVDPRIVTFRASDGAEVHARLYTPEMLDAARSGILDVARRGPSASSRANGSARRSTAQPKRPAVIFVHGAGYLQNAHRYWSTYFREYMFHHILMERGYVVLDIDYRASAGYGRDWRTAIYRHMGGRDLEDHVDGARWLAETCNVDPGRIGIYGGSYGGFITLMAMFTRPEVFAAGAALRPVTDWAHYNHPYTSNILNTPQQDAEAFRRSSPIYFAEGLRGPLLICHGMVDVNVHFQDTVRLVERLIELRKEGWELAAYPVEDHAFTRDDSWVDEYRRVLKLFETHLKAPAVAAPRTHE